MNFTFVSQENQVPNRPKYGNLSVQKKALHGRQSIKFFDSADWMMKGNGYQDKAIKFNMNTISTSREETVSQSALML